MSTALVRIERHGDDGHVAELVLDRPEAMNAVSTEMAHALGRATRELGDDPSVRAVVVTSSHPKAFCVGADLKERNTFTDEQLRAQRPLAQAAYRGVLDLPVPAVAAVQPSVLVSHTHTPRYKRVLEQTTRRAIYIVLTAALAVPIFWAMRNQGYVNQLPVQTLETPDQPVPGPNPVAPAQPTPAPVQRQTLVASMVPSTTQPARSTQRATSASSARTTARTG